MNFETERFSNKYQVNPDKAQVCRPVGIKAWWIFVIASTEPQFWYKDRIGWFSCFQEDVSITSS